MKKIKRFNESVEDNLSFDGFKEIMAEITDDLTLRYNLREEKDEYDQFYELSIVLPPSTYLDSDILSYQNVNIPSIENIGDTLNKKTVGTILDSIVSQNEKLIEIKSKIDDQIENNKLLGKIIEDIIKLKPRLASYNNWRECRLGMEGDELSITFECKL